MRHGEYGFEFRCAWSELGACLALLGLAFILGSGCASYDESLLRSPGTGGTRAADDGGAAGGRGGSGGKAGGGGTGSFASTGGMGGSGGAKGVTGDPSSVACTPNPDSADEVCPQICVETCNNKDDDCDRQIDEGEADSACSFANTTAVCERGGCLIVTCEGAFRDCNDDATDGCETDVDSAATDCGTCGNACAIVNAIAVCSGGQCVASGCEPGFDDCDADPDGVCETPVDSVTQCGACGAVCDVPNAVPACTDFACAVASCDPGHGDCDGTAANGCEVALDTLDDCGTCGMPCALVGCAGGVCSSSQCAAPAADCDGTGSDCEVDLSTDAANCGACDAACTLGVGATHASAAFCADAKCGATCDANFGDCDGDYKTGCEVALLSTVAHCSACGNDCAALPHVSTASCAGGNCGVTTCDAGWADCDGVVINGCEGAGTDTDADGFANCKETCDSDPNKQAPGLCGCGKVDSAADSDTDGILDCNDACPLDATNRPGCFVKATSNITVSSSCAGTTASTCISSANLAAAPSVSLGCNATIDTTGLTAASSSVSVCGTSLPYGMRAQVAGAPSVVVFWLTGLTVGSGNTISLVGNKPAVFMVTGNVAINGTLDAGSHGAVAGAGASAASCAAGGAGPSPSPSPNGGGGGGFGAAGGAGGGGDIGDGLTGGAANAGVAVGSTLSPLRGGCAGGRGGDGHDKNDVSPNFTHLAPGGAAGLGGGAVQISASGTLTVAAAAGAITAGGSGGGFGAVVNPNNSSTGNLMAAGGGGGGSGGAILLEATTVTTNARVFANGGGGGGGGPGERDDGFGSTPCTSAGTAGADGSASTTAAAGGARGVGKLASGCQMSGSTPNQFAGAGAAGGTAALAALAGGNGEHWHGGGGGGGGRGQIVVK